MKWFPNAEISPTGGTIYHLALNDVLHNVDEVADRDTLEKLLRLARAAPSAVDSASKAVAKGSVSGQRQDASRRPGADPDQEV